MDTDTKIVVAAASTVTAACWLWWCLKPRKPLLSVEVAKTHFNYLEHTETYSEPEDTTWQPPHMKSNIFTTRKIDQIPKDLDLVIIGSGLGGLTVGSLLAQRGYKVCILEQHDQAGGCLHTFAENNYEFDVGLHYIGGDVGNKYSPLRKAFDVVTGGRVEWCKLDDPYDKAVCTGEYDAKEEFKFYADYDLTRKELIKQLGNEHARGINSYYRSLDFSLLRIGGWLCAKVLSPFWRRLLSGILTLPAKGVLNMTTETFMKRVCGISSVKVCSVLTYLFGDYGLSPKDSAWGIHAAVFNHWKGGAYYPYGGSSALAMGACEVIRNLGGKIFTKARVKRIVVESGRAAGVEMEKGGVIRAKMVVSDAGARNTFLKLLDKEDVQKSAVNPEFVEKLRQDQGNLNRAGLAPSVTLLNLFIGFDCSAESLGITAANVWAVPGWDHEANLDKFWADDKAELPITFIGSNSVKDGSYKTRFGSERGSIMVLAPVDYKWFKEWEESRVHARGKDYEAMKQFWEDKLLARLYQVYPLVRGHCVFTDLGTPLSNNFYLGVNHGEVYGLTHSTERCWKYADDLSCETDIPGLYLTGQDIMSAGVSAALLAGIMTTAAISKVSLLSHLHNLL